jgi:PAS domain S-box-containing protein
MTAAVYHPPWWVAALAVVAVCGLLAAAYAAHIRHVRQRFEERTRAAEQLHASEARFRTFVDFATDSLMIVDADHLIVDVNEQACRSLGYTRQELIGKSPLDFDAELTPDRLRQLSAHVRAGEILTLETRYRRKDSTTFPVEVHARGFWQGTDWTVIALSRDISERKRLEDARREAEAAKFDAALEASVRERTRIARDLHDTLLQSFQGLLLRFESVLKALPADAEEARTRLVGALDRATEAVTEARQAVEGLRSAGDAHKDLIHALRTVADEFAGTGERPAAFSIEVIGMRRGKNPLVREEIARIAGEALRNAFRHAQASRISVRITYGDEHFDLEVGDDGAGIDLSGGLLLRPGHFGLRNMRERAEAVGGRLEIRSAVGSGTTIDVRVPASIAYGSKPGPAGTLPSSLAS